MGKGKNPLLEKKYQEGYQIGFKLGYEKGISQSIDFIAEKFQSLQNTPGIGPKTIQKIVKILGEEYFRKIS